jgi:hypothetical protein
MAAESLGGSAGYHPAVLLGLLFYGRLPVPSIWTRGTPGPNARTLAMLAMGRDAAQTEDGRYRLLVEAVTDYAIWVLILIVSHNLGLHTSSRCGIGMGQIGPQIDFFQILLRSS